MEFNAKAAVLLLSTYLANSTRQICLQLVLTNQPTISSQPSLMASKTPSSSKPPSDRVLRMRTSASVKGDDTVKKRAPEIPWMKNDHWTYSLIDYVENNVEFRRKLFSDATKDAKAEGRRKNTAKNSKTSFHAVLAKYIFDDQNADDEELRTAYRADETHYARSVQGQLQRLKKRYKEYCVELGETGAGLDPADIWEDSEIANKIGKIRREWPFWDRLHALWREIPHYNPVGISSTGLGRDFSASAAGLWQGRKSPDASQTPFDSQDADDETKFSDGVGGDNQSGLEDVEELIQPPLQPTSQSKPRHPQFASFSRSATPATPTTTASAVGLSQPSSNSASVVSGPSVNKKGKKRTISDMLSMEYDVAESERLMQLQRLKHEEKIAQHEERLAKIELKRMREEYQFKLSLARLEAYKHGAPGFPTLFDQLPMPPPMPSGPTHLPSSSNQGGPSHNASDLQPSALQPSAHLDTVNFNFE